LESEGDVAQSEATTSSIDDFHAKVEESPLDCSTEFELPSNQPLEVSLGSESGQPEVRPA
jgi:hypothetical protein